MSDNEDCTKRCDGVALKIAPFWSDRPEIWFYQLEAQFSLFNIKKDETKFNYL